MLSTQPSRPLRIAMLSYRSNPHCGGQGVYLRNLARGLKASGHHVEVFSGPPDPEIDPDIPVHFLWGLDLYNPADPFRMPKLRELTRPLNLYEWLSVSTMGFPEPFVFGWRVFRCLRNRLDDFDVVHDNQSLAYGVYNLSRRIPTVATIHHPITVDRSIAIRSALPGKEKFRQFRWYSFLAMQQQVAKRLSRIITVSAASMADIQRDFGISPDRFRIIPNGIDTRLFQPMRGEARETGRLIVTNSSDTALKGLSVLLEAVAKASKNQKIHLTVIGQPKKNGTIERLILRLGIGKRITFTGRISDHELVRQYARATVAVVPSLYEGFGLPVGEAMACGVPVIATTGGALPEVVGDAGILVPPGDPDALAASILYLMNHPERAARMGQAGYHRVQKNFTWKSAAEKTVRTYLEVIDGHRRDR